MTTHRLFNKWGHFPTAQEIVHWYHAVDHLWVVAHLSFQDKAQRERWLKQRKTELWVGQAEQITTTTEVLAQQHSDQQAELKTEAGYFRNNQRRMQYQKFREEGYPIGSGTVETCPQIRTHPSFSPLLTPCRNNLYCTLKGCCFPKMGYVFK